MSNDRLPIPVWPEEMRRYLKLMVDKSGGPAHFCKEYGVSHAEISQCLSGKRPVSGVLAETLGYERRIVFVRNLLGDK